MEKEELEVVVLASWNKLHAVLPFVTSTISVPDAGIAVPSNLSHGYIIPFEAYGPMTVWPDVEFYFPGVNLVGYLSVGNVLLLVSLGLLTAFAVALLVQNVSVKRSIDRGVGSSFAGTFLATLSTNACCCCTPVVLPVLAILFGGTVPSAMAESLINPQSPVSNLLALANLASLFASVILSTRGCCRLQRFERLSFPNLQLNDESSNVS
jgi:hypothetical protein